VLHAAATATERGFPCSSGGAHSDRRALRSSAPSPQRLAGSGCGAPLDDALPEEEPLPEESPDEGDLIVEVESGETVEETPIKKKRGNPLKKPGGDAVRKLSPEASATMLAILRVARDLGDRLDTLRALPKTAVVVVKGEFDNPASVLEHYKIPHTAMHRATFAEYDLKKARIVVLGCGRSPTILRKKVLLGKLRAFTNRNGSIFTTDWAVSAYVTPLFPGILKDVEPKRRQPDTTVEVERGPTSSPLLAGVFAKTKNKKMEWWFEESVKLVEPKGTNTLRLVESKAMEKRYGQKSIVIAFQVPFARGLVVHSLAHVVQNPKFAKSDAIAAMHRLFLNTILETTR